MAHIFRTRMIDPAKVTNFKRTEFELQEFLLFATLVAGKDALQQSEKLAEFSAHVEQPLFFGIANLSDSKLLRLLKIVKTGQYSRLMRCWRQLSMGRLNLSNCAVTDLENVFGIGPKTARYFLLHSRPGQRFAVLDTHILKWIHATLGLKTPSKTPHSKRKYALIECAFLEYCDKSGLQPHELDLNIWNRR